MKELTGNQIAQIAFNCMHLNTVKVLAYNAAKELATCLEPFNGKKALTQNLSFIQKIGDINPIAPLVKGETFSTNYFIHKSAYSIRIEARICVREAEHKNTYFSESYCVAEIKDLAITKVIQPIEPTMLEPSFIEDNIRQFNAAQEIIDNTFYKIPADIRKALYISKN